MLYIVYLFEVLTALAPDGRRRRREDREALELLALEGQRDLVGIPALF